MPRIKARSLYPQGIIGYHGAISAIAKESFPAGTIIVVTGDTGGALIVECASAQSAAKSSGLLYVAQNDAQGGGQVTGLTFYTIPTVSKAKLGSPVYLGPGGHWTTTKPKAKALQVGKIIDSPNGNRVLLAPQARYGGV